MTAMYAHDKEAYALLCLMSYARRYWRSCCKRGTQTEVALITGDVLRSFYRS